MSVKSQWGKKLDLTSIQSSTPISLNINTKQTQEIQNDTNNSQNNQQSNQIDIDPFQTSLIESSQITHIILDSGAFINGSNLNNFGSNCKYLTINQVINELLDPQSKQRFQSFPYPIQIIEDIKDEYLNQIIYYTKKTGEYYLLSETDLNIIALTLQIEIEQNGNKFINNFKSTYNDNKKNKKSSNQDQDDKIDNNDNVDLNKDKKNQSFEDDEISNEINAEDDDASESSFGSESSAGEWITEENIKQQADYKREITDKSSVVCCTTDFTIQNCLISMGLRCVSISGLSIDSLRQFMKKCHACNTFVNDVSREFCPECGNHTLIKVTSQYNPETGKTNYFYRQNISKKGTKYSIPLPKPSKHGKNDNLKFTEDTMKQYKQEQQQKLYNLQHLQNNKDKNDNDFNNAIEFGNLSYNKIKLNHINNNDIFGYGKKNPNQNKLFNKQKKK